MQPDRLGQRRQRPHLAQQRRALLAVRLGAGPIEFLQQPVMHLGGGHADVAQQANVEQKGDFMPLQPRLPGALGRHDRHPLAIGDILDADQIQRVGQRIDDLAQIGVDRLVSGCGSAVGSHARPSSRLPRR